MSSAAARPLIQLVELPINESGKAFLSGAALSWVAFAEHALAEGVAAAVQLIAQAVAFCDCWILDGPARLIGTVLRYAAIRQRIARLQQAKR